MVAIIVGVNFIAAFWEAFLRKFGVARKFYKSQGIGFDGGFLASDYVNLHTVPHECRKFHASPTDHFP